MQKLWFNHNSDGRTQFAPTDYEENPLFFIVELMLIIQYVSKKIQ